MSEQSWRKLELDQKHAEDRVTEFHAQLIEDGIDSFLVTGAMWMRGVVAPAVHIHDQEQRLLLCDMLQQFIDDARDAVV